MAAEQLSFLLSESSSKSPPPSICVKVLKLLRDSRLPRPDLVLHFGDIAMSRFSSLQREHWEVAAQICTAAAQLGEFEIVDSIFKRISERFQSSVRAFAIRGSIQEAKGLWKAAMETYIGAIDEQPVAPALYKRQVALFKSEMKIPEAISMINYYISLYSDDVDAWAELCALSLSLGRFSHALFAANELIVNDPDNYAYQILAADVYMTCGGKDNVVRAREHYASSLIAKKHGNLRALYGLWLACSILSGNGFLVEMDEKSHNSELLDIARNGIKIIYKKLDTEDLPGSRAPEMALINSDIITGKPPLNKVE